MFGILKFALLGRRSIKAPAAQPAAYLLIETGDKLLLEDGSGILL